MKTLILYATKYGATRKIAEEIAKEMEGATLCDLKVGSIPSLADFDCIILGSAVYAGMVRKKAKMFTVRHGVALQGKALGFFLSGIAEETRLEDYLSTNFPEVLVQRAKAKAFLGGIYDPKACNRIERYLMKKVAKATAYTHTISYEKIKDFAKRMME